MFRAFCYNEVTETNNEVTEMKHQTFVIKQVGTGSRLLYRSQLNAQFDKWELYEWHAGSLDAPQTIPAGSSIRDEEQYLGVCNAPSLVLRGGW